LDFTTNILCIGAGDVGGPTMAVIADHCPHVRVTVTDVNRERIDGWNINSISALCEKTEADIDQVAHAIGTDSRVGPKFLKASVGFGGSCFRKDILNLVYLAEGYGLREVAAYWESVVRLNEWQEARFVRNMLANMFNTVAGKRIALFGFAFKANTGDTRESPAFAVARDLLAERAHVVITDPEALPNARTDLAGVEGAVEFTDDPYAGRRTLPRCRGADRVEHLPHARLRTHLFVDGEAGLSLRRPQCPRSRGALRDRVQRVSDRQEGTATLVGHRYGSFAPKR
jgi:UDP-N-acetyl-D-mannosaminuronate dehydrogenase